MAPTPAQVRRVACIGAGTIGASWAAYFLSRGLEVVVSDPAPGAPNQLRRRIEQAWPALQRLGAAPDADPSAWQFEPDPVRAVEGVGFVEDTDGRDHARYLWGNPAWALAQRITNAFYTFNLI